MNEVDKDEHYPIPKGYVVLSDEPFRAVTFLRDNNPEHIEHAGHSFKQWIPGMSGMSSSAIYKCSECDLMAGRVKVITEEGSQVTLIPMEQSGLEIPNDCWERKLKNRLKHYPYND